MSRLSEMEKEFEEYLEKLRLNGFPQVRAECPECFGDGEVECPCCGSCGVECDECEGSGESLYPDFKDWQSIKRLESVRLKMWINGEPLKKFEFREGYGQQWPTLPMFLFYGIYEAEPEELPKRIELNIHK